MEDDKKDVVEESTGGVGPEEAVEDPAGAEGDDVKEESAADPYAEELARIQKEKDELASALEKEKEARRKQMAVKDKAIADAKRKPIEDRESLKRELMAELRMEALMDREGMQANERKLVEHHLSHSIVRTGDPATDLRNARALANAARINEILARQAEEESEAEASVASMSGGNAGMSSGLRSAQPKTARLKAAEQMVNGFTRLSPEQKKRMSEEMRKYLT